MDTERIEEAARKVLVEIWERRSALTGRVDPQPIDLLEPKYAAQVLGIEFIQVETLSTFTGAGFEATGFLDREGNRIAVADRFGHEVARFTGGHEIGHWVLHPDAVMLRERPIKGLAPADHRRSLREQEADSFAGYFLMPRKVVEEQFRMRFGSRVPFRFDYHAAHELGKGDVDSLLRPRRGQKSRAFTLATTRFFQGRHFASLAEAFRVSALSMSIQLEELGLIDSETY